MCLATGRENDRGSDVLLYAKRAILRTPTLLLTRFVRSVQCVKGVPTALLRCHCVAVCVCECMCALCVSCGWYGQLLVFSVALIAYLHIVSIEGRKANVAL